MERWKEIDWIENYNGKLFVSDTGRIWRSGYKYLKRGPSGLHFSTKPDCYLAQDALMSGYPILKLIMADHGRKRFLVHRLVGRAFVPGYDERLTINHINGIKTDNRSANLEWVTKRVNTQKQWRDGLVNLRGDRHPGSKLTNEQTLEILAARQKRHRAEDIAKRYNVSISTIYKIEQGRRRASVR